MKTSNPTRLYKRCKCPDSCSHPWWYKFMVRGKLHQASTHTANRAIAERIMMKAHGAAAEGKSLKPLRKTTLAALVREFLAWYQKEHPSTAAKAVHIINDFRDFVNGQAHDTPLANISGFTIDKWSCTHRRRTRARPSTVNEPDQGCFAGVAWRPDRPPTTQTTKYRGRQAAPRPDNAELGRLMKHGDPYVVRICRVTLECLPRLSEVLNIRREHIGPSYIQIRRKGGKNDRVKVTPGLRADLLAHCHPSGFVFGWDADAIKDPTRSARRRAARHAANPQTRVRKHAHISGHPPTQQGGTNLVLRELRRLGIKGSHHSMRHTGVTHMLEAGVNPRTIQRLAGWTSLRMLEKYGHARDAEAEKAVTYMRDQLATLAAADPDPIQEVGTKLGTARTNGPQNAAGLVAVKAVDSGG
jgi:integrase